MRQGHRGLVAPHHKSLGLCGFGTFGERHERNPQAHIVCDHATGDVTMRRVRRCGSPWSCPVCAGRVRAHRNHALLPQFESLSAQGYTSHFLTLTLGHRPGTPLAGILQALSDAWSRMTSGAGWRGLQKAGCIVWTRSFDVTHSAKGGWHPHFHAVLHLHPGHGDGVAAAQAVLERWRAMVVALGWMCSPLAQDHKPLGNDAARAAAYASKSASVYEAASKEMKRMRRDPGESRTPFEIAASGILNEDKRDQALWVDYVEAVKGRKQFSCSRSLCLAGRDEVNEAAGGDEPPDIVAGIGRQALRELEKRSLLLPMMHLVEDRAGNPVGAREAVHGILDGLEARDWRVFRMGEAQAELDAGREAHAAASEAMASVHTRTWRPPPETMGQQASPN